MITYNKNACKTSQEKQKGTIGGGNTRLNSIAGSESGIFAHLDYLRVRGSCKLADYKQLLSFLSDSPIGWDVKVGKPWSPGNKNSFFENKVYHPIGITGGYTKTELDEQDPGKIEWMFDISGSYFEQITNVDTWRLIRGLADRFDASCSRIDIALDDSNYQIPVDEMVAARKEKKQFGFRKYKHIETLEEDDTVSHTHYFGSREAGKFYRAYNHKFPDGSEIQRLEVEFKKQWAKRVFGVLSNLERGQSIEDAVLLEYQTDSNELDSNSSRNELDSAYNRDSLTTGDNNKNWEMSQDEWELKLSLELAKILVGQIDFRERPDVDYHRKISRKNMERCKFWQSFIDRISEGVKLKLPKKVTSFEQKLKWLGRQVAPTLITLFRGLGISSFLEWINGIDESHSHRLDNQNLYNIEKIKENPRICRLAL